MQIFSFDTNNAIKRDPEQGDLFNLFQKNIINTSNMGGTLKYYIIPREYEMRLDRISEHLYGTTSYVEELMVINNIINPYSVKEGQYIYFYNIDTLQNMYTKDDLTNENEIKRQELISSSSSSSSGKKA